MKKITRESCRAVGACYSDGDLAEIIPPEGLTPREVAALDAVPICDRAWVLRRAAGASDRALRLAAVGSARRALARVATPDPRSLAAVDMAERFARGLATAEGLATARRAAYAVAAYAAAAVAADAAAADAAADAAVATVATYADAAADAAAAAAAYAADAAAYAAAAAYADAAAAYAAAAAADAEWAAHVDELVGLSEAAT